MRTGWLLITPALALVACQFPAPLERFPCERDDQCGVGEVCVDRTCVPDAEPEACAAAVTAGNEHTCAIRDDGTAWCWGRNDFGQLGDGTTVDRGAPVQVAGATRFTAIAAGTDHTCAIASDKSVWCWGRNSSLQLGTLTPVPGGMMPSAVPGVTGATAIAAGSAHSCALLGDGTVMCWGENRFGQLATGRTSTQGAPSAVRDLAGVKRIAAGSLMTCAIHGEDQLSCWGDNSLGQLGLTPGTVFASPQLVPVPDPVADAALGAFFSCALTRAGAVYCLGTNNLNQLGRPGGPSSIPVMVELPVLADAIIAGDRFACATERRDARHDPPRIWCWGDDRDLRLDDGNPHGPELSRYPDVVAAAAGGGHLCALSSTGAIACSGFNVRGQLGDDRATTRSTPPPAIPNLIGVRSIAAGGAHSCAVAGTTVQCWGGNASGQLGDGTLEDRARPTPVELLGDALSVTAGGTHSCAHLADRTVACWGGNQSGQTGGTVSRRTAPRRVLERDGTRLVDVVQVEAGRDHSCALLAGGAVKCWGDNDSRQLGVARAVCQACPEPLSVALPSPAVQLALGTNHTCALLRSIDDSESVACWGSNAFGQLGQLGVPPDPEPADPVPVIVPMLPSQLVQISAGADFTCVLAADGGVYCWGAGQSGELGNGVAPAAANPTPVKVGNVAAATLLGAGGRHACAFAQSQVQCWGMGTFGQLGGAAYPTTSVAVPVSFGRDVGVTQLLAGDVHTCALFDDQTVSCWGDGRGGQLGTGAIEQSAPVAALLPCP
jgi:alpha-tubulin suppressor-like RCC1 family protein